jgi:hypothetical protein
MSTDATDRKAQILDEETYRLEVRRQLEARQAAPGPGGRLWALLNSSFALWFLSSVVLTLVTARYATCQHEREQRAASGAAESRLDTELSNRIFQALAGARADSLDASRGDWHYGVHYYTNITGYLNNRFREDSGRYDFSVHQEFRGRTFRSLVVELSDLIDPTGHGELRRALRGYDRLVDDGTAVWSGTADGVIDSTEAVRAMRDARSVLEGEVLQPRWRRGLFADSLRQGG